MSTFNKVLSHSISLMKVLVLFFVNLLTLIKRWKLSFFNFLFAFAFVFVLWTSRREIINRSIIPGNSKLAWYRHHFRSFVFLRSCNQFRQNGILDWRKSDRLTLLVFYGCNFWTLVFLTWNELGLCSFLAGLLLTFRILSKLIRNFVYSKAVFVWW